jgi:hypothetical protein
MAFQIRKGWPSASTIDEAFVETTAGTLNSEAYGEIVALASTGKIDLATIADTGSNNSQMCFFTIDKEDMRSSFVCLGASSFVVEVDSDHYVAGLAAASSGDAITASAGKFKLVSSGNTNTAAKVVGVVISANATTGIVRILWTAGVNTDVATTTTTTA